MKSVMNHRDGGSSPWCGDSSKVSASFTRSEAGAWETCLRGRSLLIGSQASRTPVNGDGPMCSQAYVRARLSPPTPLRSSVPARFRTALKSTPRQDQPVMSQGLREEIQRNSERSQPMGRRSGSVSTTRNKMMTLKLAMTSWSMDRDFVCHHHVDFEFSSTCRKTSRNSTEVFSRDPDNALKSRLCCSNLAWMKNVGPIQPNSNAVCEMF